ncbi:MAG: peptidylprolyl isomerase [Gammaproteobacteria bacterium]|nr:peptidylprolyl isomerase [Gammaproteobacteria bacterium]
MRFVEEIKSRITDHSKYLLIIILCVASNNSYSKPLVKMQTTAGDIPLELYDGNAPITVKNFLYYVSSGAYNNTFIHRSDPGFVVQGGGYYWAGSEWGDVMTAPNYVYPSVLSLGAILNEPGLSNVRGTIAMARKGGIENSATTQWFFNMGDNSSFLDYTDGGFTVFGKVRENGMTVVDNINGFPRYNLNAPPLSDCSYYSTSKGPYCEVPVVNYTNPDIPIMQDNLVLLTSVFEDANSDNIPDQDQMNVTSIWNSNQRYLSFFTFKSGDVLLVDEIDPAVIDVIGAPDKDYKIVEIFQGIQQIRVESVNSGDGSVEIIAILPELSRPGGYYVYGKTPDNLEDHWYEFNYDKNTGTGVEFLDNVLIIHLVDGQRGDSDLSINGTISMGLGAPVNLIDPPNVDSIPNIFGNMITYISPEGTIIEVTEQNPANIGPTVNDQSFPGDQYILFSQGVQWVVVKNISSPEGKVVVELIFPEGVKLDSYYLYGRTADNMEYHWYEFSFDGTTGAIITGNIVKLHLVDGGRGDSDLTVNGNIDIAGGAVQMAPLDNEGIVDASSSSGCALSLRKSNESLAGSWILVVFYLLFLKLHGRHVLKD